MITLACLVNDFSKDLVAQVEKIKKEKRKKRKKSWRAIRNGMSMYGTMLCKLYKTSSLKLPSTVQIINVVFSPYITLHYITIHYITLQYITFNYITLHVASTS